LGINSTVLVTLRLRLLVSASLGPLLLSLPIIGNLVHLGLSLIIQSPRLTSKTLTFVPLLPLTTTDLTLMNFSNFALKTRN
jgi:hypothetical protein